jgi:hypothetical protein
VITIGASAQTSYFVDKKGKKQIVRDDAIDIILIDKRISYKEVGKTWDKYITYKDLDYAVVGPYYFKTFRFGKSKKDEAFFICAESAQKRLLSMAVTYDVSYGSFSVTTVRYRILLIDNNNTILEELKFHNGGTDSEKHIAAAEMVRKHFSDCADVIERLDEEAHGIMGFFDDPEYIKCK